MKPGFWAALAFAACSTAAFGQGSGPAIWPAAMSLDYNPLLWRGDDARFALDMLRESQCEAALSKVVVSKSPNPEVQALAQTLLDQESKIHRQLHSMARTFNFHVPKWDFDDCRETPRLAELTGKDLDGGYIVFLAKRAPEDISRFEAEIDTPMGPGNYSLRKFAQRTLPALRVEMSTIVATEKKIEKTPAP